MKLDKWISSSEILAASSKRQQRGAVLMVGVDEGGICAVETNDLFLPKRQDSDKLSSLFTSLSVTETQASWERITHTTGATVSVQVYSALLHYLLFLWAAWLLCQHSAHHYPCLSNKIMIMI